VAFSAGGDGGGKSPELSLLKPAQFQIENDDDRDERDRDCEHEQNGLHVIAHPSEKHGVRHQNTPCQPRALLMKIA